MMTMTRVALAAPMIAAAVTLGGSAFALSDEELNAACVALGAEYGTVIALGNGETANLCQYESNRACTLEARQAGHCAEQGNHAMWSTAAARYCDWLGGEVIEVDSPVDGLHEIDGTCELPDGRSCLIGQVYYGTCD